MITAQKQLEADLRAANARLEALWSVTSLATADIKTISDYILATIGRMTRSAYGFYGFISEDESVMTIHSWSGDAMKDCSMVDKPTTFPIADAGVWGEAVRRREPLILNDYTADHPAKKGLPTGHVSLSNLLVVPHSLQGRVRSVAAVANRADPYIQDDVTQLISFLGHVQAIVENKRAETLLRESEANLQAIIANTDDIIASYDREVRLLTFNRACSEIYRRLLGIELRPGLRTLDYFPESQRGFWMANNARALAGESFSVEFGLPSSGGQVLSFESFFNPIRSGGDVVGFSTFTRDITERRRAEMALRQNEALLRLAGRTARFGGWSVDLPGNKVVWSEQVALIHEMESGYSPTIDEAIAFYAPEFRSRIASAFEMCAREGSSYDTQLEIVTARCQRLWVRTTGEAVRDHSGRIIRVQGSFQDINEHKRAEDALRLDEERLQVLVALSNMSGATEGELTRFATEAAVRLTNSSVGYVAVMNEDETLLTMQSWFVPGARERAITAKPAPFPVATATGPWGQAARQRKVIISNEAAASGFAAPGLPDGPERITRHMNVPTLDGDRIVLVAGVGNKPADYGNDDLRQLSLLMSGLWAIIRRKRAEEEKERLQAQLAQAQKMESVGRLAGGVAHDFNNMLGAILGNVTMLLQDLPPENPWRENLEEIEKCAQRSADLTRQLLAFARKQTIVPKVLELNGTVEGMLKMLRRLIGEDITLDWQPGFEVWPVKVDPSQIDQILANLCVNARDAIRGVGKVTLETANVVVDAHYAAAHAGSVLGEYVVLKVSDTGCGMSQEVMQHLFEPFFTTKEPGQGTGLGLATVYGIVQQNRGFINVHSEPAHGTIFSIYLPRHVDRLVPPESSNPKPPASRGQETVLLVEDEPSLLRVSKRMLESLGYTVLAASRPSEALRLAETHSGQIDLAISDVIMPEMNGREMSERLLLRRPDLKFLFMSGYTADVIARQGVMEKGVQFIQKPFALQALADKVRASIGATPSE